nr:MAG TPA: head to tail adaptor [Caudoviricetes sp.]
MTPVEAVADIIAKVKTIRGDMEIDEAVLGIYVEKLVNDVLDYCHRHDFPRALTFTCMDLINKRIGDEQTAAEGAAQLKSIEAGDTKFEFNVAAISSGVLNDLDFDSIKPKLNLYRKIAGFGSCRHHHN